MLVVKTKMCSLPMMMPRQKLLLSGWWVLLVIVLTVLVRVDVGWSLILITLKTIVIN